MTKFAPTTISGSSRTAGVAVRCGRCICTVTRPSRWTVIARKCCPGECLHPALVMWASVLHPTWQRITPSMSCACIPSVTHWRVKNQVVFWGQVSRPSRPKEEGGLEHNVFWPRGGVDTCHFSSVHSSISHPLIKCSTCSYPCRVHAHDHPNAPALAQVRLRKPSTCTYALNSRIFINRKSPT